MKIYTISYFKNQDGKFTLRRVNDGFNAFELRGIVALLSDELNGMIKGEYFPIDVIERVIVKQNEDEK